MRRYTDGQGREWDIVIGRESFGALLALFIPARGNAAGPREIVLPAASQPAAEAELEAMTENELHELFLRTKPKETG